jgi:hypothetical protein
VAERWRYKDGSGEIGVIASVTQAFCRTCNRARLSAEGKLYTCLFAVKGHDFRELMRGGSASDEEMSQAIARVWGRRTDRYSESGPKTPFPCPRWRCRILAGAFIAQNLFLGAVFVGMAIITDSTYALLTSSIAGRLSGNSRFQKGGRYFAGLVYLGLGITTALTGARK